MVEKFKTILAKLKAQNVPVSLFAILKIDDVTDRWSVIFSNQTINVNDEAHQQAVFSQLVNIMLNNLSEEERQQVARVGVFPLNNHLVESLLKYKKDYVFAEKTPVNGNMVFEGYILESNSNNNDIKPTLL